MNISLKHYLSLLQIYLKPRWFKATLLLLLLFVSIALELLNPRILERFINSLHQNLDALAQIAFVLIGLVVINQLCTAFASYLSEDIGWAATNELRFDLTKHCLHLDMSFHKAHTPGELIERVDGDITTLAAFFSRFVFYFLSRFILLIGVLIMTFTIDWRMGSLLTVFFALMIFAIRSLQYIAVPHFHALRQAQAELSSFFAERLSSLEDISGNGAQHYVLAQFNKLARRMLAISRLSAVTGRFFSSANEIGLAFATATVLTLGAYLVSAQQMPLGTLYAIYYYTTLLTYSLIVISFQITELQSATASIQRITELYNTPNKIVDGPGATLPTGPLSIEYSDVSFSYTSEKSVLQDLSFKLQPGTSLGLLGRTGSGKTTLTRLLYRFYDVQAGSVRIGGVDVRELTLLDLRTRVGVVTQDVQLFHASVRDNLTFFHSEITDERILHVLTDLQLSDWYATLPNGLDTIIAEGGITLSTGEAQLLAFARIFLQDPAIVVLDEASSRLDPGTEKLIETAIQKLLVGRTSIIIAHHLATLHHVDQILVLEDGVIREYGERTKLATTPTSYFAQLLQLDTAKVQEVLQ